MLEEPTIWITFVNLNWIKCCCVVCKCEYRADEKHILFISYIATIYSNCNIFQLLFRPWMSVCLLCMRVMYWVCPHEWMNKFNSICGHETFFSDCCCYYCRCCCSSRPSSSLLLLLLLFFFLLESRKRGLRFRLHTKYKYTTPRWEEEQDIETLTHIKIFDSWL